MDHVVSTSEHPAPAYTNATGNLVSKSSLPSSSRPKSKGNTTGNTTHKIPPDISTKVDALYVLLENGELEKDGTGLGPEYQELMSLLRGPTSARELALFVAATARPQRVCHVLALVHHLGCKAKPSLYENAAYGLAEGRKWSLVPKVVGLGKWHTGRTTVRLLNWRTRALTELGRFNQLENVLADFRASGLSPNRMAFHLLISAHIRNRNLIKAKEYLVGMEEAGIPIDASTHALIASVYRSLGLDKTVQAQALASLEVLDGRSGTIVLNSLIRMSLDKGDVNGAIQYLSSLERPATELEHYPGAISIRHDDDVHRTSLASQTSAQASGPPLSPDIATFTMLVEYLGRVHDLPRIAEVVQRMRKAGIQPDAIFVDVLLRVHIFAGEVSTAVSLVASLCSTVPWTRALFVQLGLDPLDVGRPDILLPGPLPTGRIFNTLLQGVLKTHGLIGMRTISQIMEAFDIDLDDAFVETVLSYMTKTADSRPWRLILALKKLTRTIPLTQRHALVVLSAIVRQESMLVRKGIWYAIMTKHQNREEDPEGLVPRSIPEGQLSTISDSFDPIAGLLPPQRPSYINLFRPILKRLLSRGVRSDKAAIALRLRHDAVVKKDLSIAQETFQRMLDRGMHPNRYHFTALMEGYVQCGDMTSARGIMESATTAGFDPDIVMYTILLVGYAYQGQPTLAARTFQKMLAAGITPDGKAIGVLANAYAAVGAHSTARKVLLELWSHVGPFPEELEEASYQELTKAFQEAVAGRPRGQRAELSLSERRTLRWKTYMHMWRIVMPRLQRMNPNIGWSKRTQHTTRKQQRKMARRRLRKRRDVLDSASEYTRTTVC